MERALELNKFLIHAVFNSNLFIKFSLIHSSPILSQNNWVRRKRLFLLENCLQLHNKLCFVDFSESIKEKNIVYSGLLWFQPNAEWFNTWIFDRYCAPC